jgi:N-acetylmuramoyl-L-alanine amidase
VADPCGMRLPVLRETRMPAVLCVLAPVRAAVDRAPAITDALLGAVERWTTSPTLSD